MRDRALVARLLAALQSKSGVKIAITDAQLQQNNEELDQDRLKSIVAELPAPGDIPSLKITPLEFEKDDDTNFHMDFIVAASIYARPTTVFHPQTGIALSLSPARSSRDRHHHLGSGRPRLFRAVQAGTRFQDLERYKTALSISPPVLRLFRTDRRPR
ncbi:Ubiquitin-like modifier-activating enzyme 1 [Eumeta japonica]|uniref:Ubiquitin-like modifier-activating enzyme 1 n=1 Tax=Eumeta variegata TaxID=151549 RepID=A0A4C1SQ87_EUMVA|nr:Ubiquitin-like modifier-activating enzyme 1 [Eumeta japonica]